MRGMTVKIKDDLAVTLHNIGKREDKPISALVDQLIRAGLRQRRIADEKQLCPF